MERIIKKKTGCTGCTGIPTQYIHGELNEIRVQPVLPVFSKEKKCHYKITKWCSTGNEGVKNEK